MRLLCKPGASSTRTSSPSVLCLSFLLPSLPPAPSLPPSTPISSQGQQEFSSLRWTAVFSNAFWPLNKISRETHASSKLGTVLSSQRTPARMGCILLLLGRGSQFRWAAHRAPACASREGRVLWTPRSYFIVGTDWTLLLGRKAAVSLCQNVCLGVRV